MDSNQEDNEPQRRLSTYFVPIYVVPISFGTVPIGTKRIGTKRLEGVGMVRENTKHEWVRGE